MDNFKITERTIDVENVFRQKSPAIARLMPGFIYRYLRKVVHEEEINEFLFSNKDYMGLEFVDSIIKGFGANVKVKDADNIPAKGRYIIAANHPLGGLDGVALMQVVGKVRNDIVFPVNDLLMYLPNLQELFIPINKHGSNAENMQIIRNTFESDKIMLYFPSGLVSRKQNGKIEDLEWKNTFVSKAKKYKRDIIPVFIKGENSGFFYNLANFRKRFNIKANLEMLYLADEMYKQKNKTIEIIIGKPILHQTIDKKYNFNTWAKKIRAHVYSIGNGNMEMFNPE